PTQRAHDAFLPGRAARYLGPTLDPDGVGAHGLPDVHVGMPGDQDALSMDPLGDPALLRTGDQVVHEYAEASAGAGSELVHDGGQVVDPLQELDRHALHAQIVSPDFFDKFRVVRALDVDTALAGHTGT